MISKPVSEDEILSRIDQYFPQDGTQIHIGRGDDCAILLPHGQRCFSSDLFLEDIHFRRSYFEPAEIGHKALAVNLSDLAAMGAKPLAFNLCLGIPSWADTPWLEEFLHGMSKLAAQTGIILTGGDISRAKSLHISITAIGEAHENGSLLLRGGSVPGDTLFLVGEIGLSRIGLEELEKTGRKAVEEWPAACAAHLHPQPQLGAGITLARTAPAFRPPTLMDVSDGLARDLPRMLAKNENFSLGAEISIPDSLLHSEVLHHAWITGNDPALEAFQGGEDYALLGTCDPASVPILQAAIPGFHAIGVITSSASILCNNIDVTHIRGFDHLAEGD